MLQEHCGKLHKKFNCKDRTFETKINDESPTKGKIHCIVCDEHNRRNNGGFGWKLYDIGRSAADPNIPDFSEFENDHIKSSEHKRIMDIYKPYEIDPSEKEITNAFTSNVCMVQFTLW